MSITCTTISIRPSISGANSGPFPIVADFMQGADPPGLHTASLKLAGASGHAQMPSQNLSA